MHITVLASGSSGNAYLVDDGVTTLLLEAGIAFKEIQRRTDFQTSRIAACLLSHEHGDHAKAARELLKAGIDVYASGGTIAALGLTGHRVHQARARERFTVGSWAAIPFEAVHDAAEPLGFLLASGDEKCLYLTDSMYSPYRFEGLTHILIEANYDPDLLAANVRAGAVHPALRRRIRESHMSLESVKKMLLSNDLSRIEAIYLIHLSAGNSNAEQFKREIQALTGKPVRVA